MKNVAIAFLVPLFTFLHSYGENIGLKTNLLYDGAVSPNIGVEVRLTPRWTLDISGNYNPFELSHGRMWKHWLLQPELRRWLSDTFRGSFLAAHLLGGEFNYSFGGNRRQGWGTGLGVGYGYTRRFAKQWGLEVEIAVGYVRYGYKKYPCSSCGRVLASREKNYFGPTKAALNIVYYFGERRVRKAAPIPTTAEAANVEAKNVSGHNLSFILIDVPATKVKRMEMSYSANLKFRANQSNIDSSYLDSGREIGKIVTLIDSLRSEGNTEILGIHIEGHASPDGSYKHNKSLAKKRAEAVKEVLESRCGVSHRMIDTQSVPEDWTGLRRIVETSDIANRSEILALIDSNIKPDTKERRIESDFPEGYDRMKTEIFPRLRRTDLRIDYVCFSIPEEATIFQNANRAIMSGDYGKAEDLLKDVPQSPESVYTQGVVHALRGDYGRALDLFEKAKNEGIMSARNAIDRIHDFQTDNYTIDL